MASKGKRELEPGRNMKVGDALQDLYECGYIGKLSQYDLNAWLVAPTIGWEHFARGLSERVRHLCWPSNRRVSARAGGGQTQFFFKEEDLEDIQEARETMESMGFEPSWSVPHMARTLVKSLGRGQFSDGTEDTLLRDAGIGYHEVTPGWYDNAHYYDMRSCYYQLLCRASQLCVDVGMGEVHWHGRDAEQWEKWQDLLQGVKDCKSLRNTMWGAMLGSADNAPRKVFLGGEMQWRKMEAGRFRALAVLVGRTGWELCRAAAIETQTPHAHTDAVLCVGDTMPRVWDQWGLKYRLQKSGLFHIQGPGAYSVNGVPNKLYTLGECLELPIERAPEPQHLYYAKWL